MPHKTQSHFAPDLANPQTLVWRNRQVDYRSGIAASLFILIFLWLSLLPPAGVQQSWRTAGVLLTVFLTALIYWRHAVYDFFCDPPLAICDPQGLTLYGYYGKISHQWRWDALEQVTISYDATPFEELLDSSHAILCITLRNTGDGYLPPLKLHVDGLDGASELNALAIAAQRYIDGETPVPVTLPADWQRDWYKYPNLIQRGNLNHFWLLLPQLLLLKMTIAAGKHLHAATADDIVFYIPLWCLTAIATIAVCLNIRHNFFQRTQPLARADCHGLHLALRRTPIRGMPLLFTGPLNTHIPWQEMRKCVKHLPPNLSWGGNYTQHIGLIRRDGQHRIIITECLGKNDAPTEDLCVTIRAILDGTVPPAASPYPPLRARPFAWYLFAANTGYAFALCGSLLPIWTVCIAAFANLVILALPWQWQAEFSAPPPDAPPLMQEKPRA